MSRKSPPTPPVARIARCVVNSSGLTAGGEHAGERVVLDQKPARLDAFGDGDDGVRRTAWVSPHQFQLRRRRHRHARCAAGSAPPQTERKRALRGSIERHAEARQGSDRRRGGARDAAGGFGVAKPVAGAERVGQMQRRIVVISDAGRETALGPGAGPLHAERRLGNKHHGMRRHAQRRHQPGEASANDDRSSGECTDVRVHIASILSTA